MCLAIPACIISIEEREGRRSATASVAGVERQVDLTLVPEAAVGDYVVTHSGYAISTLSRVEAGRTLSMLGIDSV